MRDDSIRPGRLRRMPIRGSTRAQPAETPHISGEDKVSDEARAMVKVNAAKIAEIGKALDTFLEKRLAGLTEGTAEYGAENFSAMMACLIYGWNLLKANEKDGRLVADYLELAHHISQGQRENSPMQRLARKLEKLHARGESIELPAGLVFNDQGKIVPKPPEAPGGSGGNDAQ